MFCVNIIKSYYRPKIENNISSAYLQLTVEKCFPHMEKPYIKALKVLKTTNNILLENRQKFLFFFEIFSDFSLSSRLYTIVNRVRNPLYYKKNVMFRNGGNNIC